MTSSERKLSPALLLAALGVVYGDIGTSPLYAFKESLAGEPGAGTTPDDVYGVLSMIFWAITLVVSIKYVLLVLRADNDSEGGILQQQPREPQGQGRCRACCQPGPEAAKKHAERADHHGQRRSCCDVGGGLKVASGRRKRDVVDDDTEGPGILPRHEGI